MHEILEFARILIVLAAGFTLAVVSSKVTERIPVPAPAIFLFAAAVASDVVPSLSGVLSIRDVERISVVALILILFQGGMHVGYRRLRESVTPIVVVGVAGTFLTAGIVALAAHYLTGVTWTTAAIIGTALAPTDPAVVFSVLGRREVAGRTGTILEGESGANDPVGIALMLGVLELATGDGGSVGGVAVSFLLEMGVGVAAGIAGALLLLRFMRHVGLPSEGLYGLRTLGAAGLIYGAATLLHGSGFIAVFVAGILIGDANAPYKAEIERFHASLASLAEIVVFTALGLTITLSNLSAQNIWLDGLILALILAFVARPLAVGALLMPVRLRAGERLFVMWGGLKGAVPILLGAFALLAGVPDAGRVYSIVFVVVAFSVVFQGATIPLAARRLGIPMRVLEPEPWDLSIRLRREPRGVQRYVVGRDAQAHGVCIRDLPLGEKAWISLVIHDGAPRQARGSYVIEAGDEVLLLAESEESGHMQRIFEGSAPPRPVE